MFSIVRSGIALRSEFEVLQRCLQRQTPLARRQRTPMPAPARDVGIYGALTVRLRAQRSQEEAGGLMVCSKEG